MIYPIESINWKEIRRYEVIWINSEALTRDALNVYSILDLNKIFYTDKVGDRWKFIRIESLRFWMRCPFCGEKAYEAVEGSLELYYCEKCQKVLRNPYFSQARGLIHRG